MSGLTDAALAEHSFKAEQKYSNPNVLIPILIRTSQPAVKTTETGGTNAGTISGRTRRCLLLIKELKNKESTVEPQEILPFDVWRGASGAILSSSVKRCKEKYGAKVSPEWAQNSLLNLALRN